MANAQLFMVTLFILPMSVLSMICFQRSLMPPTFLQKAAGHEVIVLLFLTYPWLKKRALGQSGENTDSHYIWQTRLLK